LNRLWLLVVVGVALNLGGCAREMARLRGEQTQRDIYLKLMTDEQRAVLLEMEAEERDEEQRILYCQEVGVYQKWRAVPPEHRALIRRRGITEGMAPDEVRMAWGTPAKVEDITTAAERAEGRARLLWSFDPLSDAEGTTYGRQVCFLDGRLLWHKDVRGEKSLWQKLKWWQK
jgi:hypothetical protein